MEQDHSFEDVGKQARDFYREHGRIESDLKHLAEHKEWLTDKIAAGADIPALDDKDGRHSQRIREQAVSSAERSIERTQVVRDANLWRAQQHAQDNLDAYTDMARLEMEADLAEREGDTLEDGQAA